MIFFSDMDGTFLTTEKTVSETSRHALDAIAEAGFEFVPSTGRALTGIPAVSSIIPPYTTPSAPTAPPSIGSPIPLKTRPSIF